MSWERCPSCDHLRGDGAVCRCDVKLRDAARAHWSSPSNWPALLDKERESIRAEALEEAAKAAEAVDQWALVGQMDVYSAQAIKRRFASAIRALKTNTNPKQEGKP